MTLSVESTERPITPWREIMGIAVPTILQMASYTIQQFTDILMLARLSDAHATASGMGGILAFCIISMGFGILMLVNAMVGHAFGAGKLEDCGPHLWQGIWLSAIYGLVATPSLFIGRRVFSHFGHGAELVVLETTYFVIVISFLTVKMLAVAIGQFLLAMNRPRVVLVSAAGGVALNIFANWVFIFGKLGMPAMGIAGAAWGTNLGVSFELLVLALVAFGPRARTAWNTRAWRFDRRKFGELVKVGLPSGFQSTADILAWMLFMFGFMAVYGDKALAANNYMLQYMKVSFMPAFGIGVAVSSLVARYIGAGNPDVAAARSRLGFMIAGIYMFVCGVLMIVCDEMLLRVFTDDAEVIRIGKTLFFMCALYQVFDAMFIIYGSALRGAKDTFWPAAAQIIMCWVIMIGGGWLVSRYKPEWGAGGPWAAGLLYGILLGFFMLVRFRVGGWRRQRLSEQDMRVSPLVSPANIAAVEPIEWRG